MNIMEFSHTAISEWYENPMNASLTNFATMLRMDNLLEGS